MVKKAKSQKASLVERKPKALERYPLTVGKEIQVLGSIHNLLWFETLIVFISLSIMEFKWRQIKFMIDKTK